MKKKALCDSRTGSKWGRTPFEDGGMEKNKIGRQKIRRSETMHNNSKVMPCCGVAVILFEILAFR